MNNDNGRVFTPLMIQLLIQELFAGQKAKHSNRAAEGMLNVTEFYSYVKFTKRRGKTNVHYKRRDIKGLRLHCRSY